MRCSIDIHLIAHKMLMKYEVIQPAFYETAQMQELERTESESRTARNLNLIILSRLFALQQRV